MKKADKNESPPPLIGPLTQNLLKTSLLALVGLILWGGVNLREIWMIVGLVLIIRLLWLIKALADGERSRQEIGFEALSLFIVVPCAILLVLMLTRTIVSFTGIARWPIALSLMAAIALHFAPAFIRRPLLLRYYRPALALVMLIATASVMQTKHPYLLKTGPENHRLIAEKVWNLGFNFEAAGYADKLFTYGDDLIAEGRLNDAAIVYERGLEFDIYNDAARKRLASISQRSGAASPTFICNPHPSSTSLWVKPENVSPVAIFPTPPPAGFSIVLVPCGDIPRKLLDRLAAEVSARIGLPVYRYHQSLPLPPPDRSFGLIGNRQWTAASISAKFSDTHPSMGGFQYIVVMAQDIFTEDTNFVFGTRLEGFHGLVSYARFGSSNRPPADDDLLIDRLSKQVLSISIKCFGMASNTTDCVTSMSRSLDEFDRKAQVPCPAIRQEYMNAISTLVAHSGNGSPQ